MDTKESYDLLIHIVNESNLTKPTILKKVKQLFPKFTNKPTNDDYLSEYVIDMYSASRSLGLSVSDSANAAKISSTLMHEMLEGVGLSLDRFVDLIEQEVFAVAEMKYKHLNKLDNAADLDKASNKASIAFLEKIYPTVYGPRATITHDVDKDIKKKWELVVSHVEVQPKKESSRY